MSQQNESGLKAFTATEALEAYRRVKLTTSSGTAVEYADAGEEFIGITQNAVAIGEMVTVALRSAARTYKAVAAGVVAVGAAIYGAADGKVDDAVSGTAQGTALEAATADGDVIEILSNNGAAAAIGADMLVTEEANSGVVPVIIRKACAFNGTPDAIAVATTTRKLRIIDWCLISKDTTASNITVKNAGTSISTAVLAKGTANDAIVRGATLVAAQQEVASGAAITVESSVASVTIELVLVCVPVA